MMYHKLVIYIGQPVDVMPFLNRLAKGQEEGVIVIPTLDQIPCSVSVSLHPVLFSIQL